MKNPDEVTPPNKNAAIIALIKLVGSVNKNTPRGVFAPFKNPLLYIIPAKSPVLI